MENESELQHIPNNIPCELCDDTMIYDHGLYSYICDNCGHKDLKTYPEECIICGSEYPRY